MMSRRPWPWIVMLVGLTALVALLLVLDPWSAVGVDDLSRADPDVERVGAAVHAGDAPTLRGHDATSRQPTSTSVLEEIATCPLHGRVVDDETGEGIAWAVLFLGPRGGPPPRPQHCSRGGIGNAQDGALMATKTGHFGFRRGFGLIARGRDLALHVSAEGPSDYAPQVVPVDVPGEIVVRLKRGWSLEGAVYDEGGRPVSGAAVHAEARWLRTGFAPHSPVNYRVAFARTDERGAFILTGLPPEPVRVAARDSRRWGRSDPLAPDHAQPVEIVLGPWQRIRVHVKTEDGGPIQDMRCGYTRIDGVAGSFTVFTHDWEAERRSSERRLNPLRLAPFGGVEPGPLVSLNLMVSGYRFVRMPVVERPGGEFHEIVLERERDTAEVIVRMRGRPKEGIDGSEPAHVFLQAYEPGVMLEHGRPKASSRLAVPPGEDEIRFRVIPGERLWARGRDIVGVGTALKVSADEPTVVILDLDPACALETIVQDAPLVGVDLMYERITESPGGHVFQCLEWAPERARLGPGDDRLPGCLAFAYRWTAWPREDGTARAVAYGLAPGRYVVWPRGTDREQTGVEAVVEAGRTTTVVLE